MSDPTGPGEPRPAPRTGSPPGDEAEARSLRADQLKERIYLTFAALAVVLALGAHEPEPTEALRTLAVTVFGLLLAVFTADVVSHLVVHERFATRAELRRAGRTSFGAIGAVTLPFVFLGLAAAGQWSVSAALRASAIALIVSLVVIGVAAVRRADLTLPQRLTAYAAEAALGLLVIGLQVLAHG